MWFSIFVVTLAAAIGLHVGAHVMQNSQYFRY
jgi:hypothetical protein